MNIPANKRLWTKIQRLVRGDVASIEHRGIVVIGPNEGTGFKKHPSAYSNGYAVQVYRRLGGQWRGVVDTRERDLETWFRREDWVAIDARGNIVGPCAQSANRPRETRSGQDPLKCLPRKKAESMTRQARVSAATRKKRLERSSPDSKKPVRSPTFAET